MLYKKKNNLQTDAIELVVKREIEALKICYFIKNLFIKFSIIVILN